MENREKRNQVRNCFKRFEKELARCIKENLRYGSFVEIIPNFSMLYFYNPKGNRQMFSSLFDTILDVSSYKEKVESVLETINFDVENDNIGQFTYTDIQYILNDNVLGDYFTQKYQALLDEGKMDKSTIIEFISQVEEILRQCFTFKEFDDFLVNGYIDEVDFITQLNHSIGRFYESIACDDEIVYSAKMIFKDVYNEFKDFLMYRYFSYKDGKIKFGEHKVPKDFDCNTVIYRLCKNIYSNFNAVMTENKDSTIVDGDMYVGCEHINIFQSLLMNGVDITNGIRIVDNSYRPNAINPFEISHIDKFGGRKIDVKLSDNELTYFGKRRLRKIVEYLRTIKPDLTKQELCNIFMDAEGFGYDFISTSNGNFPVAFDLGMENLRDIMSVLDEYFPYDECTDLVEKFKERERNSYDIMEVK